MADRTVSVRIEAQDRASAEIERAQGSFERLGSFLSSRFVVTLGDLTRAFGSVRRGITSFVTAAAEQEAASKRLAAALGDLGPGTAEFLASLERQAAALQETTRFSDDAILGAQALLRTFGAAPAQLGPATEAAVDLAAALGISLPEAARLVGSTLSGITRGVDRVVPGLRDLGKEALAAGDGIDLIAAQFRGRAAADATTFSGALEVLKNAFGELQEGVGNAIVQNEQVSSSIGNLTTKLREVTPSVSEFTAVMVDLASKLGLGVVAALETVGTALGELFVRLTAFETGAGARVQTSMDALGATADRLGISVEELQRRIEGNVAALGTQVGVLGSNSAAMSAGAAATSAMAALQQQLATAAAAVAPSVAAAGGAIAAEAVAAAQASDEVVDLSATIRALGSEQRLLRTTTDQLASSFDRAAASAAAFNLQVGVVARSRRAQSEVDAAVAAGNRPYLGGTRIRTLDGGSRLVG